MLVPIFTLKLNQKILPRLVTVGSYDGAHPSLTAATNGGKVFLHTPHHRLAPSGGAGVGRRGGGRLSLSETESDVTLLSMGQHLTSLVAGKLHPQLDYDLLMVGSQTNLLAYDIERNTELFYKDLPDGANAMIIGELGEMGEPLLFVGGNCAIQGFDHQGEDKFWTVTGDNVCSLALCDFNANGYDELLVGSEDYDIRVFQGDELMNELSEADAVVCLCRVHGHRFGYALANGIVGVYGGEERYWRIKSKHQPMCLHSFDLNNDGVPELITGWSSGKVDVRSMETGNVIFKDTFSSRIAGIVQADYRQDGHEELICCSVDGEVRGYLPTSVGSGDHASLSAEHKVLEELSQKKQKLLLELKNFEVNEKVAQGRDADVSTSDPMGVIPAGTLLKTEFSAIVPDTATAEKTLPHIELTIQTSNQTILRSVVIFAEGLFDGESHIVHPPSNRLSSVIKVPLFPEKDTPIDLNIKAFVGHPSSTQFHVFEATRPLPRFSLYIPCSLSVEPRPHGSVTFQLSERIDRILSWINDNFMYGPGEDAVTSPNLHIAFLSLRTNSPIIITLDPAQNSKMTLETDDMDLAGDMVQSLANYMDIEELTSVVEFPHQMSDLRNILNQVDDFHKVRQRLTAEMADNSGVIRNLVVRAEDARMMNDMVNMKKAYQQLYELNKDLITGYKIRCNNHLELLDSLRIVNQAIQRAGRLRVGKAKTQVVSASRTAIKNNDVDMLFKVIRTGSP